MKKRLIVLSGILLGSAPLLALAQGTTVATNICNSPTNSTIEGIICHLGGILNTIIPILIVLGVLYFVWGVITYVIAGDEEKKKSGRDKMVYGIIGLVVIVGLWGLVTIVANTFGLQGQKGITVPCIQGTPGC